MNEAEEHLTLYMRFVEQDGKTKFIFAPRDWVMNGRQRFKDSFQNSCTQVIRLLPHGD